MKRVVDAGKTLLVDGPVSVRVLSGNVSVLGAFLQIEKNLVVRQGKRLPLWIEETATIELMLGDGAFINEVDVGTTPSSWGKAVKQLLSLPKPVTVIVVGGVDSGKTSFCTFLVNEAVKMKLKTAVIDADLGQSDVGPPSTVGFSFVDKPVKDLFDIDAQDAFFVGSTSPSRAMNRAIDGLSYLKCRVLDADADFVVLNTDGWVEGKEASAYKVQLVKMVGCSAVVGMQRETELKPILDLLEFVDVLVMESPHLISARSRQKRKLLRELGYKKYLKGAKVQSISFKWVKLEDSLLGSGVQLHHKRLERLRGMLMPQFIYSEESGSAIFVVLKRNEAVTKKQVKDLENHFGKRVKVIREGDEAGLLVALKNEDNKFLGIGLLHEVDYKRKVLKVYTPVTEKPSTVCFGQIKLNKNFKEIGLNTAFCETL